MSGKKSGEPTWKTCEKCNNKFPNFPLKTQHAQSNCAPIYPMIDTGSGALFMEIGLPPTNTSTFIRIPSTYQISL